MKKITTILLLISTISFSQDRIKKEQIYKSVDLNYINAYYEIDNNDKLTISWMGQDSQYQHIDNIITLYSAEPIEFLQFLNSTIAFITENEINISGKVKGRDVSISKLMGVKIISIYTENLLGYKMLTLKRLNKIKEKYLKWCEKKGIKFE